MSTARKLAKAIGLAAIASAIVGFANPAAQASPVPPKAHPALYGTWVNTNPSSPSVKQISVTPTRIGSVYVDAFGACVPTLCEWGAVPATVYGTSVSSTLGTTFQSNQRFISAGKEWSRRQLQGTVASTRLGLRLSVRELTTFSDGSNRKNYTKTEVFKLGAGQKITRYGYSVSTYLPGYRPSLYFRALGTWKNPTPTGGLVALKIYGTTANPVIQAFGQCSPTPCNWGVVRGITYGASISSTVGTTALAPYTFSFKKAQLVIQYWVDASKVEHLQVKGYNEFTDSSGRSNYLKIDNFVRA